MPDPNNIAAATEIQATLDKYDLAGIVLLSSPRFNHYVFKLNASWSCAFLETDEQGREILRIRASVATHGTAEKRDEALAATVGMLTGFVTVMDTLRENSVEILTLLGKQLVFTSIDRNEGYHSGDGMRIDDFDVIEAMAQYGGSFVKALADAARRADRINLAKIKSTWPDYWQEYRAIAVETKKKEQP